MDDCVQVYAHKGLLTYMGGYGYWYVYPPNWIERLLGITYRQKIEKATRACQDFCDRHNREIEQSKSPVPLGKPEIEEIQGTRDGRRDYTNETG